MTNGLVFVLLMAGSSFGQVDPPAVLRSYPIESFRHPARWVVPPRFGVYPVPPDGYDEALEQPVEGPEVLSARALQADLLATALPSWWNDSTDTFLSISPRRLMLLAPQDVQERVATRLAALRDAFDTRVVWLELEAFRCRPEHVPSPGIHDARALAELLQTLRSAEVLFASRILATPWDDHVFDDRTHTKVVCDVNTEGVAGAPPALDPVVSFVAAGPYAILRQTPLAHRGWVQLHVDLRDARLRALRSATCAGAEDAHIDLPDVAFEGVTQTVCLRVGSGAVFVVRGRAGECRVFVVRVTPQAPHGETSGETFLDVAALTSPLQHFVRLPVETFHDESRNEELRPRIEFGDVRILFPRDDVLPSDEENTPPWLSTGGLSEPEREAASSTVRALERTHLLTTHLELEIVEAATLEEPTDLASCPVVESTTSFALPGDTSRAAIGRCVSFLGDWDVEVSMGTMPTDPVVEQEFVGTWVHVTPQVVRPDHATFHLELFVHVPAFATRTVQPTKDIEPIDLPVTAKTRIERDLDLRVGERVWLGRVPGGADGHVRHAFARLVRVVEFGD
ncbi:MAG: hypothetical protein H6834_09305 [Planctomycetes bacterium]|nr:hypothetical protein [Planctomycetota bacterium]